MSRNQLVFILIIGAALAIVAVGLGIQALSGSGTGGNGNDPQDTPQNALTIEVAVDTLAEEWLDAAVDAYNGTDPEVRGQPVIIKLVRQDSLGVWGGGSLAWSPAEHPVAWIPEASYAIEYARVVGMQYAIKQPSLAETPLIWGVYTSRSTVLENTYSTFDGAAVQQAAVDASWDTIGGNTRWGFIKLAMARPDRYSSGLGTLFTLAGAYNSGPTLSPQLLEDPAFHTWLAPLVDSVPNFSTLDANPAQVMATRGTSTADLGLLPESQWLLQYTALNTTEDPLLLYYPDNYLLLNFPFAIWSGPETTDNERRAAEDFGKFLMSGAQQRAAGELGLRPASGSNLAEYTPFNTAQNVIQMTLTGSEIVPPERPAVLALLRWFSTYRTAS